MKNQILTESYLNYRRQIDTGRLMQFTQELYQTELPQTFTAYHQVADKAVELLKRIGLPNVEKISFPADGKTAYQDKITPLGWECSTGKLTIEKANGVATGFVLADYAENPFNLIKGSVGTLPGGEVVNILPHKAVLAGADVRGALVLAPLDCGPGNGGYVANYLDRGARGFISDYSYNAEAEPDGVQWCNAYTERKNWHVNADDREFIAFSISPRMGRVLRAALDKGAVTCRIESDARRVESTVDVVTACVPGKRKEEFWIVAHLYEPLANDNSSGVAAAMETARLIMDKGIPEFSLRLVFAMEHYGFAAYAEHRNSGALRDMVIGGCDYDAMYLRDDWSLKLRCAPPGVPFYGNAVLKMISTSLAGAEGVPELEYCDSFGCMYDDDAFLGDATIGVPVMWPIRFSADALWHNSKQTMEYIHPDAFNAGCALNTLLVDNCVNPDPQVLGNIGKVACEILQAEPARAVGSNREHLTRRMEILCGDAASLKRAGLDGIADAAVAEIKACFETVLPGLSDEIPTSPWREYAEKIVVSRKVHGFPFDLAKVPADKRRDLPGSVLYGPLAGILSNMDGKKNMAQIIRDVEHESGVLCSEKEVKKLLTSIFYLAEYGYLDLNGFKGITKDDIVKALRNMGIKEGDFLLIHSSLSAFGFIGGGEETVIEAFKEAVGETGTFLFPALIFCFANIGGPNTIEYYRAFDVNDLNSIWTGSLPRYILREHPEAVRSRHITHCWCGIGALAAEACAEQAPYDPPTGATSPLNFALKHNGKILHFGNTIGSTTFLHFLEEQLSMPGLADTLCMVKGVDGIPYPVCVPRNLPGCRDFYQADKNKIKFFIEAEKRGLEIKQGKLGLGTMLLMDMQELYKIGLELCEADPFILIHDEGKCASCDSLRAAYHQAQKQH